MSEIENKKINKFIQENSPDGGFLQSKEWINFQESAGNSIYKINNENFWANIISYKLPIVGSYFYIPRGPIFKSREIQEVRQGFGRIIKLAKEKKAGWIRVDVKNEVDLSLITEMLHGLNLRIKKAPHDMQPRQIFKIDISKNENELLSEMKSKTRYNIRLASKKEVKIKKGNEFIDDFLRLVKLTSERQGIMPHPDNYYKKMLDIPGVELYVSEFEGKIIVANLIMFYGETATYLHGASDNDYRNVMAPFLLQWQTVLDAKEKNYKYYDFGGVKLSDKRQETGNGKQEVENKSWEGITRFKLSFSKDTSVLDFKGSYDIVISPIKYGIYRILQTIKSSLKA